MASKLVRIGVVSDSHGDITSLEAALSVMGELDYILHAGDHLRDSVRLSRLLTIPVIGVAGNCDALQHPTEELIELGGQRFFIAHGHHYGVKTDTSGIIQVARRHRVDIAIYGHTHVPALFVQHGILFLNPGSTSIGRKGAANNCAVLTIDDTHVDAAFIPFRKNAK